MDLDRTRGDAALTALGEQLELAGERFELVIIGGSGLLALGLIDRTTGDVDLVALRESGDLVDPRPLPQRLLDARDRVAGDLGLAESWLNAAPGSLLDFGLPTGFEDRLEPREYGPALTVWLASRLDQIHFKLYAAVDQQGGRHENDLRALDPTRDELVLAARWTRTQDPSDGFLLVLRAKLADFGLSDADLGA